MVYYVANILQIYETEEKIPQGGENGKVYKKKQGKKKGERREKGTKKKIVMWYLNKQNKLFPFVYAK